MLSRNMSSQFKGNKYPCVGNITWRHTKEIELNKCEAPNETKYALESRVMGNYFARFGGSSS